MKRWLLVPVALFTLVAVVPAEGSGLFRKKKSCDSGSNCGQVVVGYETKKQEVTVAEWVTETRKVKVTEYHMVPEKRTITRHKCEEVKETKPVTFTVYEKVKETRSEDYWVCERAEAKKTGTRKVAKHGTKTEARQVTKDHGHWETQCVEVACSSSSCGKKGLFGRKKKSCDDECAPTTKLVSNKVWVSKPVTTTENVTIATCDWVDEKYDYVEVSYNKVKKTRAYDVWVCKPTTKTENRTFVSYKTVEVKEDVTVNVCKPSTVEKDVQVKVCRHVTKVIDVKVPVYGPAAPVCAPASDCAPAKKCCK